MAFGWSAMLALTTASAAIPASWNLEEGRRYRWASETELVVPGYVWLYADRNRDVRARNVGLKLVIDCMTAGGTRRAAVLQCDVSDVALFGATFPNERGNLQIVLDEMDHKLTHAKLTMVLRHDGRLRTVKLDAMPFERRVNRRTRYMEETLRLLVARAVAPFDLTIPRDGLEERGWPQRDSRMMHLMTQRGTAGAGHLVHRARQHDPDRVLITSVGRATLTSGNALDLGMTSFFDTDFSGITVFDVAEGRVTEALWTLHGEPTASSGVFAQAYASRTQVTSLAPDEVVELPDTLEWTPLFRGPVGFRPR